MHRCVYLPSPVGSSSQSSVNASRMRAAAMSVQTAARIAAIIYILAGSSNAEGKRGSTLSMRSLSFVNARLFH